MVKNSAVESWSDFYDEARYIKTLDSYLFRNPYKIIVRNDHETETVFKYSLAPGKNYIFDQKPIAKGITAYFGFDEVTKGIFSLKTRLERDLDFNRDGIFEYYMSFKLKFALRKNQRSAWPKSKEEVTLSFYKENILDEKNNLKESEKFFCECKDDSDKFIKDQLKDYVLAYIQWLQYKFECISHESTTKDLNTAQRSQFGSLGNASSELKKNNKKSKKDVLFPDYFKDKIKKDKYAQVCKGTFGDLSRGKADAIMLCILNREDLIYIYKKGRTSFYKSWYNFINEPIPKRENFTAIYKYLIQEDIDEITFKYTHDSDYDLLDTIFMAKLNSLTQSK